jgi:hypothetical protein
MSADLRSDVKPSEADLPPETSQDITTGLGTPLMAWERRVNRALHDDDKGTLRDLFLELSTLVPPKSVSPEWLRVVSGWDARAKTG